MTLYRMYYKSRQNPDISGEGHPVATSKEAHEICEWHNKHFPDMKHTWERGVFEFQTSEE